MGTMAAVVLHVAGVIDVTGYEESGRIWAGSRPTIDVGFIAFGMFLTIIFTLLALSSFMAGKMRKWFEVMAVLAPVAFIIFVTAAAILHGLFW